MFTKVFPTVYYWKYDIPNFDELKEYVKSKKNVVNEYNHPWTKGCLVDTTFINEPDFVKILKPSLDLLTGEAFAIRVNIDAGYPWINRYKKGYHQEIHDHKSDIASVFFLNEGEDFSEFYFYNRYNVTASNRLLRCLKYNELNEGDKWTPEYKAGQVLFFPGTMLHGVTPHKSDVVRETLSCNFDIV